jgi:hypothetical protein
MAKKPLDALLDPTSDKKEGPIETVQNLTDEHKKALRFLIDEKRRMAQQAEQFKEDVKALAEKLGTKSGKVNRLIGLAIQEEEKGGVVREQIGVLEWVEQLLELEEVK